MPKRYWNLEFRDAPDQPDGIQCRLRDGAEAPSADQGWDALGTSLIPHLRNAGIELHKAHDARCEQDPSPQVDERVTRCQNELRKLFRLGDKSLGDKPPLPTWIQSRFEEWVRVEQDVKGVPASKDRSGPTYVVSLRAVGDAETSPSSHAFLEACLIEALPYFKEGRIGIRRILPVAARVPPAPAAGPTRRGPLRVVVLVGKLDDARGFNRQQQAVRRILDMLQSLSQHYADALEVKQAATRSQAAELEDIRFDTIFETAVEIETLLAGAANAPVEDRGHDILVTLGHSSWTVTHGNDQGRTTFDFGGGLHVPAVDLARWCNAGNNTRSLALLVNCRSAAVSTTFLHHGFDQVLAIRTLLSTVDAEILCEQLFQALCDNQSLTSAVALARQHLRNGWIVQHLSRSEGDPCHTSGDQLLLSQLYRDLYRHEASALLESASRREIEFTRIHVPLGFRSHEPQVVDFEKLLEIPHRRWLIRGDAGSGKTTTLTVKALSADRDEYAVLFKSLPKWAPPNDQAITGLGLLPAQHERIEDLKKLIVSRAERGRLLVLLDAYDEVPGDRLDGVRQLLAWIDASWPRAVVVVTARPHTAWPFSLRTEDARGPLAWREARIEPLDRTGQLRLLAQWFQASFERPGHARFDAGELSRQVADAVESVHPELQSMARLPLFLTLLADGVLEGMQREPSSAAPLGWVRNLRRHSLLDAGIDILLRRTYTNKSRPSRDASTLRQQRSCLRSIAWNMTTSDAPETTLNESDRELLDHCSVLRPERHGHTSWRFVHSQFRESLAAEHAESIAKAESKPLAEIVAREMLDGGRLGRWRQPLVLLAERNDDSSVAHPLLVAAPQCPRDTARERADVGLAMLEACDRIRAETVRLLHTLLEIDDELELNNRWPTWATLLHLLPGRIDADGLEHLHTAGEQAHRLKRWPALGAIVECLFACAESADLGSSCRRIVDSLLGLLPALDRPKLFEASQWIPVLDQETVFTSGPPEQGPGFAAREVRLDRAFHLGRTPVTREQYRCMVPDYESGFRDESLATGITWWEAKLFTRWMQYQAERITSWPLQSGLRGTTIVLPTELQLEYAARLPKPEERGLLKHVHQWCDPGASPLRFALRRRIPGATSAILPTRGGSYRSRPEHCHPWSRSTFLPWKKLDHLGFRLCAQRNDS